MTQDATLAPVRRSVTVRASQERAFEVFADMGTWWPGDTYVTGGAPADAVLEPREGGRWFERARGDGAEHEWGRVLTWEPPARLVLAWHLDEQWRYDPDPARATEVEVRFEPRGEGETEVTLEHRGFERLGEAGPGVREPVASDGGWGGLLQRYVAATAA